jgi:hypothetical protein
MTEEPSPLNCLVCGEPAETQLYDGYNDRTVGVCREHHIEVLRRVGEPARAD